MKMVITNTCITTMEIINTPIKDLIEIVPKVFNDDRGYFLEDFHEQKFLQLGLPIHVSQSNRSFSIKGALRGLHFQRSPHEQGKLVSVVSGAILDVAVDLRKSSETLGEWYSTILSGENNKMLYIPPGFAHGFLAIEPSYLSYKCTSLYDPHSEGGIIWDDPTLNIDWQLAKFNVIHPIISEKDSKFPQFKDVGLF